jgi:hypothetical protein
MRLDMASNLDRPSLVIAYSQNFSLEITCTRAQEYTRVGLPGVKEYFFATHAKIRHPTGYFEYRASDVCFDIAGMERFLQSLTEVRGGRSARAKLSEVGEMVVLDLELKGRRLHCSIDVRESQAGEELTTLHAGFDVDYDLFVNKLREQVIDFIESLKSLKPEQV